MDLRGAVCVLLGLVVCTAWSQYCGSWDVIDVATVPKAAENDTVEMVYLAAPLLYCSLGDKLAYLNGYHGGIGFANRNTGYKVTFNYDAYPNFAEAVFPDIQRHLNGSVTLEWNNDGKVFTYEGINTTYWHSVHDVVATLSGNQFNVFIEWMKHANDTFTEYNTLAVYKSFPNEPWFEGYECFQFAFDLIALAMRMGAKLKPGLTHLKQSIANVYTRDPPLAISFDDPKYHDDIIRYFEMIERKWKELGVLRFIEQLIKLLFLGDCYVHYGGRYYSVDVNFPYFEQHWMDMPLNSSIYTYERIRRVNKMLRLNSLLRN